jgi:carboxymethylenebutenolidase
MPIETRTDTILVADGSFDAHVALPEGGSGPGLLLLQEIFGVGPYIKAVAERLAGMGYVAVAPDLFWRIEPGFVAPEGEQAMAAGMAVSSQVDRAALLDDTVAALAHVRSLPEVHGRAGVIGFCFGGQLAFELAAAADPDTAVSYYGSGIASELELAPEIACPILFHFGEDDPWIPQEQVDQIRQAFAGRPDAAVSVQRGGGHAFDNFTNPMFSRPDAAAAAWEQTASFLASTLPVDADA